VIEIKMPRLSDTMGEGAISTWRKQPGDAVAVGDVLVEIETDKAVMEYEAYQAGTLAEILVPEGGNADIGVPIALLDDGAGGAAPSVPAAPAPSVPAAPAPSVPAAPAHNPSTERTVVTPVRPATPATPAPAPAAASPAANGSANANANGSANANANGSANGSANGAGRPIASPLVRKLAREKHLDLSHVTGSGPGGRIIRADLNDLLATGTPASGSAEAASVATQPASALSAFAATPTAPVSDDVRETRGVPVSQVRRVIARRLAASAREIPHFYVTAVADAQALMDLRATLNAQLTEAGRAKLSVNDLLVRACALALRDNPDVNVSYGGDASGVVLVHDRINIGVAVAAESGLIVPVIRDADAKTVSQLGAEARKLVALAAERKLTPDQTSGGTFTISNLGMFGVEHFTAIINPPESAILAVGATTCEPTVVGDTLEPRYRLRYTLSVDHRVIDGALAAKFLQTLTSLIEHPATIIA
jgi:pyruvate dehydrogenase E2 component (dihydrolipoamide acetyltransferase)